MKIAIIFLLMIVAIHSYASDLNCSNPVTTNEINVCKYRELKEAEKILDRYLKTSEKQYKDQTKVLSLLEKSQAQWLEYREAHCDAIYQMWSGGTIRGVMHGQCMVDITKKRTYELWKTYLTFMDSTPPLLPEPK